MPAIHPTLAVRYRDAVARLEQELAAAAKSALRNLITTIKVCPGAEPGEVELELHGQLATVLGFAEASKAKAGAAVARIQVSVVAGACHHFYGTRLRLPFLKRGGAIRSIRSLSVADDPMLFRGW